MSMLERPVNISINVSAHRHASGYIWTVVNGEVRSVPFIVDRPQLIKRGLNPHTYNRIMRQLRSMKIEPEAIELHSEQMKYLYDGKCYKNKSSGIPMSVAEIQSKMH